MADTLDAPVADARVPAAPGHLPRLAYAVVAVGALVGVGLIIGIAAALHGVWRVLALALLTPVLVVSALALWRAARLIAVARARRARLVAELRRQAVIGALALPSDLSAAWQERVQLKLRFLAGPHLLAADDANTATPAGQRALHALYALLGEDRHPEAALTLPARATLALLESNDDGLMWDLAGLFERADAGDVAARDELAALEAHVMARVAAAARGGVS